jgi:hypothetical protein
MIDYNNITSYNGFRITPREAEGGPEAGKTSIFIIYVLPALASYRKRLQSCYFRVPRICVATDRQSSQGLKL